MTLQVEYEKKNISRGKSFKINTSATEFEMNNNIENYYTR